MGHFEDWLESTCPTCNGVDYYGVEPHAKVGPTDGAVDLINVIQFVVDDTLKIVRMGILDQTCSSLRSQVENGRSADFKGADVRRGFLDELFSRLKYFARGGTLDV